MKDHSNQQEYTRPAAGDHEGKLKAYKDWLQERNLTAETQRTYASCLRRLMESVADKDFHRFLTDSQALKEAIRTYTYRGGHCDQYNYSIATYNGFISAVSSYCQFANIRATLPQRKTKAPPVLKPLTSQEAEQFLAAIGRSKYRRDQVVALLVLKHGIRLRECSRLNISDVNFVGGEIRLQIILGGGKNRSVRSRYITLDPCLALPMANWMSERSRYYGSSSEDALFLTIQGKRMSSACIDLRLRRIGIEARMVVSAERLRDTFLVDLVRHSRDKVTVAELGGYLGLESARHCINAINNV